eukprot:GEMP01038144.1.p1 GENE.GEMP01038144.1~~GEMP01038144.1.p1  ORF type:complete len:338 (+),score=63.41 GEMP01038144.1:88-1101(+)
MTVTQKLGDTIATTATSNYLKAKFQVGSSRSDKINYVLSQNVFHREDIPQKVLQAKQNVQKSKEVNILGAEPREWNQSVAVKDKSPSDNDLKRQLLRIRAGLMGDISVSSSKGEGGRSQEEIDDTIRYIVSVTGKGPIGFLTRKWFDAQDERRLMKHTVKPWKKWNESTSTLTPEDIKNKDACFAEQEVNRINQNIPDQKLALHYGPMQQQHELTMGQREKKIEFQDLKEHYKKELKTEFPNASEQRLQAMAQRLLDEKLRVDEKVARFPVQHERFRPNLALTTQDRRYKEYSHIGKWSFNTLEQRFCWSCCMNLEHKSRGCEVRVSNPDSWCMLHC